MNINILKDSKTDSKQPKVYDLGTITSTLQALLDVSSITITDEQTIILKVTDLDTNINYYLLPLKDYKGSTIYGLGKDILATDLINISGTITPPNITQVITQGNIQTFNEDIPNDTFLTLALERRLTENYYNTLDVGTGGLFLDKTILFPENSATITFQAGYGVDELAPTPVALLPYRFTTDALVFYQGSLITDIIIQPNEYCILRCVGTGGVNPQIWFLTILNRRLLKTTDEFADDAAAAIGGIEIGSLYHTAGAVKIRLL